MKKGSLWGLVVVGTAMLFSCAGVGVWYVLTHTVVILGDDTDAPTTAEIEHYGRFKLPPSTKDVRARLEGFQDHSLWVRFTMDPVDEAGFWASTQCGGEPSIEDSTSPEYARLMGQLSAIGTQPWWDPRPTHAFAARLSDSSKVPHVQAIIIDKRDPKKFTVFLRYLET